MDAGLHPSQHLESEIRSSRNPKSDSGSGDQALTYDSAKGLTFDTVLLPRLVNGSFERPTEDRILSMMFVAVTRAARWVYLSTVSGQEAPFLTRLAPLVAAGDLTLRTHDNNCRPAPQAEPPEGPAGLDDLFG